MGFDSSRQRICPSPISNEHVVSHIIALAWSGCLQLSSEHIYGWLQLAAVNQSFLTLSNSTIEG